VRQVCEVQDEARSKMLQNEMWICCNLLSQSAADVDEVCSDAVRLLTISTAEGGKSVALAERIGSRTCDGQVVGSTPGHRAAKCNPQQVGCTRVPLSPSSII